jgi:restriction system protein
VLFGLVLIIGIAVCLLWLLLKRKRVIPIVKPLQPLGEFQSSSEPSESTPISQKLCSIDWFQFEKLVSELCRLDGFSVERLGGANPDGGIDLMLRQEGRTVATQCKHWRNRQLGVRHVREFIGAMADKEIREGTFVTLCGPTEDAKALAERHGIAILGEAELTAMLEAADWKFNPEIQSLLASEDKTCPKCERKMVLRTAGRGEGAGRKFWGCEGFPVCRYVLADEQVSK